MHNMVFTEKQSYGTRCSVIAGTRRTVPILYVAPKESVPVFVRLCLCPESKKPSRVDISHLIRNIHLQNQTPETPSRIS